MVCEDLSVVAGLKMEEGGEPWKLALDAGRSPRREHILADTWILAQ